MKEFKAFQSQLQKRKAQLVKHLEAEVVEMRRLHDREMELSNKTQLNELEKLASKNKRDFEELTRKQTKDNKTFEEEVPGQIDVSCALNE